MKDCVARRHSLPIRPPVAILSTKIRGETPCVYISHPETTFYLRFSIDFAVEHSPIDGIGIQFAAKGNTKWVSKSRAKCVF